MKYVKLSVVSVMFSSLFLNAIAVNVDENAEIFKYKDYSLTLKELTNLIIAQMDEPVSELLKNFFNEYKKEYIDKLNDIMKMKNIQQRKKSLELLKSKILEQDIYKDIGKDYWTDNKTLKEIYELLRIKKKGLRNEDYIRHHNNVIMNVASLYIGYLATVLSYIAYNGRVAPDDYLSYLLPESRTGWAVFCIFWICVFWDHHEQSVEVMVMRILDEKKDIWVGPVINKVKEFNLKSEESLLQYIDRELEKLDS